MNYKSLSLMVLMSLQLIGCNDSHVKSEPFAQTSASNMVDPSTGSQLTTSGVLEGSNLYYTEARVANAVNSIIDNKFTNDITINGVSIGNGPGNIESNTVVGGSSLTQNTSGLSNTAIGNSTLVVNSIGSHNTALGVGALLNTKGDSNTGLGSGSLMYSNGNNNIGIGRNAGALLSSGSNNVIIGSNPASFLDGLSNNILISDGGGNVKMRIDSNGNAGIGTLNPTQKLEVSGGLRLNTLTSRPTCDAAIRGTLWATQGNSGIADSISSCLKDAVDSYSWRIIY